MEVWLLGNVGIHGHGQVHRVPNNTRSRRCLLAALAMQPGKPIEVARLLEMVWLPDQQTDSSAENLQTYAKNIRAAIRSAGGDPDSLRYYRGARTYCLDIDPLQVDYHRFGELAKAARLQQDPALFDEALALWRGVPLADLEHLEGHWAANRRIDMKNERLAFQHEHFQLLIAAGEPERAFRELTHLVEADPTDDFMVDGLQALAAMRRQTEIPEWVRRLTVLMTNTYAAEPSSESLAEARRLRSPGSAAPTFHSEVIEYTTRAITQTPPAQPAPDGSAPEPGLLLELVVAPATPSRASAPSALLRAERGVVGFQHRDDVLAELLDWATSPARLSLRLLTGQGGQGKTRLAAHLAAALFRAGWIAGTLPEALSDDVLDTAAQVDKPLLLVIDYAEGRVLEVVRLLSALVSRQERPPARILLVSRAAGDWLRPIREHSTDAVADLMLGDVEVPLPPLLPGEMDRPTEFARALAAFANELGTGTAGVAVPPDLTSERYGCVLDLHAAALAALLDRDAPSGTSGDPLSRVLHHERRYWRSTLAGFDLPDPHPARLDALVATATAFGAPDRDAARAVLAATPTLRGLPDDTADRYFAWLSAMQPGPHLPTGLYPDRLGEDHLAEVLRVQPEVLVGPLAVAGVNQRARVLTVLGRAIGRHPHLAAPLARVIAVDPGPLLRLATETAVGLADPVPFTQVMAELARDLGDRDAVWELVEAVPSETTALADFAVVVAEGLAAVCAAPDTDPAERAVAARFLAEALVRVNQPERAVTAAAQAAALFGELVLEHPELYTDQVDALITAADALLLMGQYEASLDRLEEAAELLSSHVGDHVAEIAVVLDRTGVVLSSLGQSERALECANTVIELAAGHPELRAQWAGALAVRGELMWEQERFTEAVADFSAAERLRRELVADNPDVNAERWVHERLALAHSLAGIGRFTEAADLSSGALTDTRELVARYGDRFLLLLADVYSTHATVLHRLHRDVDAEVHYSAAIDMYRVVSDERPELCLNLLASALYNRASVRRNRPALAVADDEEAADILRKLADRRPDAHIPELVLVLMDQWSGLSDQHLDEEALAVAQEAADWAARIPRDPPTHLQAVLLKPLHGLTSTLGALDRHRESVTVGTEAVRLARRVLRRREDPHLPAIAADMPNLADLLHLLGKSLASLGRHRRAVRVFSEAVGIYRAQARHDPASITLEQANLDNDLAVSLSELGRLHRAVAVARRAECGFRTLGDHPSAARVGLAMCLGNIAAFALEEGNLPEAIAAAHAAVDTARSTPEADLPTALVNLACVAGAHDLSTTVTALVEALELADELDGPELREWALSELWEHPTADVRPLWAKHTTKPYPEPQGTEGGDCT